MLNHIIGATAIVLTNFYIWSKLLKKHLNFKDYKLYLISIVLIGLIIINYFFNNKILSLLLVIILYILTLKIIFKTNWKDAVLISIITQFLYILAESIVVVLVVLLLNINKQNELIDVFFGTIYANLLVSFLVLFVGRLKIIYSLYKKLKTISQNEKVVKIFTIVIVLILCSSMLFYCLYFKTDLVNFVLVCTVLTIGCFIMVIRTMATNNNYLKMSVKYNNTLETLKSYEDILDKYKVSNHENKNQLLMIRNMLGKDTKGDVSKYIDNIVKNEYQDDENLIMETSKIPAGGLRALIYSKLLYMKNNDILFELKIDRKIRSVHLVDLNENLILDICKIVGVFLDNAIEECKKIKSGSLSIELYMMDDKFHISIANTFEGSIDLDKIDMVKYTTKGNEHGYGLALVKEIINKNSNLENVRMINDNVFIQILKISI
ncbi:MAG: GHKL domain-containing protein [Firmicutes bacterium]|nr:GHKL domain-containing protein [Bacillota bacterium]